MQAEATFLPTGGRAFVASVLSTAPYALLVHLALKKTSACCSDDAGAHTDSFANLASSAPGTGMSPVFTNQWSQPPSLTSSSSLWSYAALKLRQSSAEFLLGLLPAGVPLPVPP